VNIIGEVSLFMFYSKPDRNEASPSISPWDVKSIYCYYYLIQTHHVNINIYEKTINNCSKTIP